MSSAHTKGGGGTLLLTGGAVLAVCLVVLAFVWPAATSSVEDIPVVVAGPGADQVAAALGAVTGDTFDLTTATDRASAVDRIERRDVDGAVVIGPEPAVLVASAGSPAVAQLLRGVAPQLQQLLASRAASAGAQAAPVTVAVEDVVPLSSSDPSGTGMAASVLPVVLGGIIGGAALGLGVTGRARRLLALAGYAAVGGMLVAVVLHSWFDVVPADFWPAAGAYALALASVGVPTAAAVGALGRRGLPVGPVLFMFLATPIASSGAPTQLLPGAWGTIGQLLPPGASATLVRTLSYFPDATTARPWLVLAAWAAAGVVGVLLTPTRRGPAPLPDHRRAEPRPAGAAVPA